MADCIKVQKVFMLGESISIHGSPQLQITDYNIHCIIRRIRCPAIVIVNRN